jgi:hypothetical protein
MIGKLLCWLGFHNEVFRSRGDISNGSYCVRKDCHWKTDPIKWPKGLPRGRK